MKPLHYSIHLEPNINNFTFNGKVEIKIEIEERTDKIILDANKLDFKSIKIKEADKVLDCKHSFDEKEQKVTIQLPKEIKDVVKLIINYSGKINDLMAGFYRSKYDYKGQTKYLAITQFEESDARMAFPCFDHPSKKATFDIEFIIDEKLMGISNTPIVEEKLIGKGRKIIRFERTPKMSTYLVFFGVGEFESIEEKAEKPIIRVLTTPGKIKFGDFALQMARKSMKFGEDYTGIPFPIAKCDYIAVPDFAFGAMENYGAITFRENLLLVYPNITSKTALIRLASVIAHETAHMWFGNLVSPKDWKYVWLNESLASYFTHAIPNQYYPEWSMWEMFVIDEMLLGLERDSLIETLAVEIPGDVEAKINSATADIVYYKGASILRMIINYLGEEKFRKAINSFLNKYKFGNASSNEFWETFDEATSEPIKNLIESWIYQEGYPLVSVEKNGDKIILTQRTFSYLPNKFEKLWKIPLNIILFMKSGETKIIKTLLENKMNEVIIPKNVITLKINTDQTGFYRVKYDNNLLTQLGQLIKDKKLKPIDRFGIENDFYALVRSGEYSLDAYLQFLEKYYDKEDEFLPITDISNNLLHAYVLFETERSNIERVGRKVLEKALLKVGYQPRENDTVQTSAMRNTLLWSSFKFGDRNVADFGEKKFQGLLDGEQIHADILLSILKIGAVINEKALDYFINRVTDPNTPETERIFILTAMGHLENKQKLLTALKFNLEKIPSKNKFILINSISHNIKAIEFLWSWFLENLKELEKLHPNHLQRVILSIVPMSGLNKENDVKEFFKGYLKKKDAPKDTINMSLEKLSINSRLRKRGV